MVTETIVRQTDYTEVVKEGIRGPGNAFTLYTVVAKTGDTLSTIQFHQGNPTEGVNGIMLEDLMAICIDRLTDFQAGPFACGPNQIALDHLKQALNALDIRTAERKARGVEGKLVK